MILTLLMARVDVRFALGQTTPKLVLGDSSVPRILAHLGSNVGGAPDFVDLMRQTNATTPQATRDALADTAAGLAIAALERTENSASYDRGEFAVIGLGIAGTARYERGTAYDGALGRLIRIHQNAHLKAMRALALNQMLRQRDRATATAYLQRVARSDDPTAVDAVNALIADAEGGSWGGPTPTNAERGASARALRDLATQGRVVNRQAYSALLRWSRANR